VVGRIKVNKQSIKIFVFMALLIGISLSQNVPAGISEVAALPIVPYMVGNWTYIGKPMSPIKVNESQIWIDYGVDANWTYVCNLKAGAKYHIYFYGQWIDSAPLVDKTDYDIYIYDPFGQRESMHTESAGLPEHLGTTVNEPFFIPKYSGNYSILVKNDGKESKGAKGGTLMVIEYLECNHGYDIHMQGKVNNRPVDDTYWAYEFMSFSGKVEVWVEVPDTLDMYEVQLYLMANPSEGIGTILNGVPLPWEPGLYGNATSSGSATYGGYRLDGEGFYHANASASCEYYGQDMLVNYSSGLAYNPSRLLLYHLALIAEEGEGTIRFMFKTDFTPPTLNITNPIDRASSDEDVEVTASAVDSESGLQSVTLNYTVNNWANWTAVEMAPSADDAFVATIPRQLGGKTVKYRVAAVDVAGNTMTKEISYAVKNTSYLYIALSKTVLQGGGSTQVVGWLSRGLAGVTLDFVWQGTHTLRTVQAGLNGSFTYEFAPDKAGTWTVSASWLGDQEWWEASSEACSFSVQKFSTSVTCNVGRTAINLGEDLDVAGYVLPAERNIKVIVSFTKPDGTTVTREVYTGYDGSYELLAFQPNLKGQWQVQARIAGDEFHQPSSSNAVSLAVNDTWFNEYKIYIIGAGGVAGIVALGVFLFTRGKAEVEEE
jgi:hypothetical protein